MSTIDPARTGAGTFGLACSCLAAALLVGCGDAMPRERARTPNVVLIVIDTLRADALDAADTPHLDGLHADGVVFPRAYSHAPMTLSSHTALFASRHPFENGVLSNRVDVPVDLPLFPEHLGEQGWRTRAVFSLGTLGASTETGLGRAFDEVDTAFQDVWLAQAPAVSEELTATLDELEESESDGEAPFFLFAHFSDPHYPYNAHGTVERSVRLLRDGELLETLSTADMSMWRRDLELGPGRNVFEFRSDDPFQVQSFRCDGEGITVTWEVGRSAAVVDEARIVVDVQGDATRTCSIDLWVSDSIDDTDERERRYELEVEFVDRHVGLLLDELTARGWYDDALIVFTSDHGEALGEHGVVGHIQTLYDEMLHVPLVIKVPDGHPAEEELHARRAALFPHVDVVPTLLNLMELPALPGQVGRSLLERDETSDGRVVIAETHKPICSRDLVALRDDAFKMIHDPDEDAFEMYDLAADPGELEDVFDTRRSERESWVADLRAIAAASRAVAEEGADRPLDPETRAQLEALGYGGGE